MNCIKCNQEFSLTKEEPGIYERFNFEPSGLCFSCDQKQRLCFRNERNLYQRKCDATGTPILSIYSKDKPFKIYKNDYWYSDNWDPMEYGREFDFDRPFFEQFNEMQKEIPRLALSNIRGENSENCNMTYGNKNCYLVFGGDFNEDTIYGTLCMRNENVLDADYSNRNQLCYMISDSIDCYECQYTFNSKTCSNCYFIGDCIGCKDCILCTNLIKRSYCILNKQYTKKEYEEKKQELIDGTFTTQQKNYNKFLELYTKRIVKYAHAISCQNCCGDYLKNCKNCHNTFDASESEDLINVIFSNKAKNCLNCSILSYNSELCYNTISTIDAHGVLTSFFTVNSTNITYSMFSINSKYLFGCFGLMHKSYCILNKKYSKTDYEILRKKIINHMQKTGEWSKFFPSNISPFGYNETSAHDYFPLTKDQALSEKFNWKEIKKQDTITQTYNVPENIKNVDDSIIDELLSCNSCSKNYKIIDRELNFYRTHNIPIPHICPDCRHHMRSKLRTPRKIWHSNCQRCHRSIRTPYEPGSPETVCCEPCYLQAIHK